MFGHIVSVCMSWVYPPSPCPQNNGMIDYQQIIRELQESGLATSVVHAINNYERMPNEYTKKSLRKWYDRLLNSKPIGVYIIEA